MGNPPAFPDIAKLTNEEMESLQQQLQSVHSQAGEIAEATIQSLDAKQISQRRRLFNAQTQSQSELMTTVTMAGFAFASAALVGWFLWGRR